MYRQHDNLGLQADISIATYTMKWQQDIWEPYRRTGVFWSHWM